MRKGRKEKGTLKNERKGFMKRSYLQTNERRPVKKKDNVLEITERKKIKVTREGQPTLHL